MRIHCHECGKSVSTEVSDDTVIRAWLTCPECIEKQHNLPLEEEDRQLVLLALAHLAVERPGWDHALQIIAGRIDNPGPELFNKFKELHAANIMMARLADIQRRQG